MAGLAFSTVMTLGGEGYVSVDTFGLAREEREKESERERGRELRSVPGKRTQSWRDLDQRAADSREARSVPLDGAQRRQLLPLHIQGQIVDMVAGPVH